MVRALNEYDLTNDWRKKLETNKGISLILVLFVLESETWKLRKWILECRKIEREWYGWKKIFELLILYYYIMLTNL